MRVGILMAVLALLLSGLSESAHAMNPVTVEAALILASNNPAPLDTRLDRIEFKLRRIFKFEHYRFYGEGRTILNVPGESVINLGHGIQLFVTGLEGRKGKVRATVVWKKKGKVLLKTTVVMSRNTPAILGGPPHEGGNLIVTLTLR